MKEIMKDIFDIEEASKFTDLLMRILKKEITETDDKELNQFISFSKENPDCEIKVRNIENGVTIGLAKAIDRTLDGFEWGSAN